MYKTNSFCIKYEGEWKDGEKMGKVDSNLQMEVSMMESSGGRDFRSRNPVV